MRFSRRAGAGRGGVFSCARCLRCGGRSADVAIGSRRGAGPPRRVIGWQRARMPVGVEPVAASLDQQAVLNAGRRVGSFKRLGDRSPVFEAVAEGLGPRSFSAFAGGRCRRLGAAASDGAGFVRRCLPRRERRALQLRSARFYPSALRVMPLSRIIVARQDCFVEHPSTRGTLL